MGVPKFFRWLSERYPKINQRYGSLPDPETTRVHFPERSSPPSPFEEPDPMATCGLGSSTAVHTTTTTTMKTTEIQQQIIEATREEAITMAIMIMMAIMVMMEITTRTRTPQSRPAALQRTFLGKRSFATFVITSIGSLVTWSNRNNWSTWPSMGSPREPR
jgi:hypothetical protein